MIKQFLFILLIITITLITTNAQAEKELKIIDATIVFEEPDPKIWKLVSQDYNKEKGIGQIMYKRVPIIDSQGFQIEPVMAIVYEKLPNKPDLVMYSLQLRMRVPFSVDKMFTHQDGSITYPNSLGYEGHRDQHGKKHNLLITHMIYDNVGIQFIGDSTADVYSQVEGDMRKFIKSIKFKK